MKRIPCLLVTSPLVGSVYSNSSTDRTAAQPSILGDTIERGTHENGGCCRRDGMAVVTVDPDRGGTVVCCWSSEEERPAGMLKIALLDPDGRLRLGNHRPQVRHQVLGTFRLTRFVIIPADQTKREFKGRRAWQKHTHAQVACSAYRVKKFLPNFRQWPVHTSSTVSFRAAKIDNQHRTAHTPSFSRMWDEPVPKLSSPQMERRPASMRLPKNFQPVGTSKNSTFK